MIQKLFVNFVRAGSKTIKNKNIQLIGEYTFRTQYFNGKKLFANSNIYISTNSKNDFYCN